MQSHRQRFAGFRHLPLAFAIVSTHASTVLAAAPAAGVVATHTASVTAACSHVSDIPGQCKAAAVGGFQLSLPEGGQQCPDSGTATACSTVDVSGEEPVPGIASTPDGLTPCPVAADATLSSPAACSDGLLPATASSIPPDVGQVPSVAPSVPVSSLQPAAIVQRVNLTASVGSAGTGEKVVLTASASSSVAGTGGAIEIFDVTAGALAGACTQGSRCTVSYAATLGTHTFAAFITAPTTKLPTNRSAGSNEVAVSWIGLRLKSSSPAVGPGKSSTVTANATVPAASAYPIQLYDADSSQRLTYCSHGNTCSVSLALQNAGARSIIAILAKPSPSLPAVDALAQSERVTLTWLAASISATYLSGSTVNLTANASADLTNTPWSLGILDQSGHLVGRPCKSGGTCAAQVPVSDGAPAFSAVIGQEPQAKVPGKLGQLVQMLSAPTVLVDIQARSAAVTPKRMLWGVDSCESFTGDPSGELYPKISGALGSPDFWGRYLTDAVCPPLSSAEISLAHAKHMGILPIYNERDCSNVAGYNTGRAYAAEAVAAAHAIGLPQGRGIAIDIEPYGPACPGAAFLDTGLIQGWYDGIMAAHYLPIYYGNGTPGTEFATQWCNAVTALPYIGEHSYLWSFQPSLLGNYTKSNAPAFAPKLTGCLGYAHAWQYQIGSESSTPDVDGDEATSELPIWFP